MFCISEHCTRRVPIQYVIRCVPLVQAIQMAVDVDTIKENFISIIHLIVPRRVNVVHLGGIFIFTFLSRYFILLHRFFIVWKLESSKCSIKDWPSLGKCTRTALVRRCRAHPQYDLLGTEVLLERFPRCLVCCSVHGSLSLKTLEKV